MLFILNLAIGAGSGLALSIPFLGWLEAQCIKDAQHGAKGYGTVQYGSGERKV